MRTFARVEPEARWERDLQDETKRYARVLCGKLDKNGVASCPGPLAWLWLFEPLALVFEGMRFDGRLWLPTTSARAMYQRTGVLTEPRDSEKRETHMRRDRKAQAELRGRQLYLSDITVSPVAVCVRCDEEQDLMDAEDLALCASAMLPLFKR